MAEIPVYVVVNLKIEDAGPYRAIRKGILPTPQEARWVVHYL